MKALKWKLILVGVTILGIVLYLMSPSEVTVTVEKPTAPMSAPRWST